MVLLAQQRFVENMRGRTASFSTFGDASYSGTLSFGTAAVPEPATWALMLLGFGALGVSMRRRRQGVLSAA